MHPKDANTMSWQNTHLREIIAILHCYQANHKHYFYHCDASLPVSVTRPTTSRASTSPPTSSSTTRPRPPARPLPTARPRPTLRPEPRPPSSAARWTRGRCTCRLTRWSPRREACRRTTWVPCTRCSTPPRYVAPAAQLHPPWGSIRVRLAHCAYEYGVWGVRVVNQT